MRDSAIVPLRGRGMFGLSGELSPRAFLIAAPFVAAGIIGLGSAAVHFSTPGTSFAAWWPAAGLSVAFFVASPRRLYWAAGAVVFAATFVANATAGRDADLSAWYGVGNVIEALVAVTVLSVGFRRTPQLATLEDVGWLLLASFLGAASLGLWAGAGITWLSGGDFWTSVFALTASHMSADAIMVPLVLVGRSRSAPAARVAETALQFTVLLVVTLLAYVNDAGIPVTFAPMPFLMWAALRLSPRMVSFELLLIGVVAVLATNAGYGPFGANEALVTTSPRLGTLLLQSSILSAALVALPLMAAAKQRRNALFDARASRDELLNVVDSAHGVAIIATDVEGMIQFWSAGAQRLFGYAGPEVIGKVPVTMLSAPDNPSVDFDQITRPLREGQRVLAMDRQYMRKNGTTFTGHVRLSRRLGRQGQVIGYMGVVEDVEEERRAQAALQAALEKEQEAVERMAALDRTKNDFIASVSHELRTPITSVIGYTDLLASQQLSEEQSLLLDPVRRNARRLELLIEDLLTVSRMEGGTFVYRPWRMDLAACVRDAVASSEMLRGSRDLAIHVVVPQAPVPTVGDPAQIERALTNLLGNAIKFTPDGGRIDVGLEVEGDKAVITVADTGVGIPVEEQPRIFERFYRSSRSMADAVSGTGLGLHILSEVVKAHSGSVSFESAEGRGTTFTITLPLRID